MLCVICQEDDLPQRVMAKTPCAAHHGRVACKPCLLKWFEHRVSCPLCNAALQIKCCLPLRAIHARRLLKAAQKARKEEARQAGELEDAAVARRMQQEEMVHTYLRSWSQ